MSSRIDDDPWLGSATLAPKPVLSPRARAWIAGCGVALLLALAAGGVLLYALARRPKSYVVESGELPTRTLAWLHASGMIEAREVVEHFYSPGPWTEEDTGVFQTDRRVVRYRDGAAKVDAVRFEDLARLERRPIHDEHVELVFASDVGAPLVIALPTKRRGDLAFEEGARTAWRALRPEAAFAADGIWCSDGELPASTQTLFVEQAVIAADERPLAAFGALGYTLSQWCTLVTDRRLIVRSAVAGAEPTTWSLFLSDVDRIEFVTDVGGDVSGAKVHVTTRGEQSFDLGGERALLALFLPRAEAALARAHGK